jgi:hypothetical protein
MKSRKISDRYKNMDAKKFFQVLGTATRLDLNDRAESEGCVIHFGDSLEVIFEYIEEKNKIYLFSQVLKLNSTTESARIRLFSALLQLHLLGIATEDAYFGFDPDLDRIILFRTLSLEHLNSERSVQAVEAFVNQLERWQTELLNVHAQPDVAAENSQTFSMQRI